MSYTATQEEISAAWAAWKSRHGDKLGPGPAFVEAINAALSIRQRREEAALSTDAEPVAARYDFDGQGFQYIDSGSGSDWKTRKPDAEMLYDRPQHPAPAVAVKALADAYQKYLDASALYNERLAIAKTKAPGTMRVDEERKAIDDARRAFDKLAVEVATTSVSAQVQDVSGLELRPHEPTEEMLAAAIKADQDGMPASMKTIWMVMWAAYSASPASKQGGAE